MNYSPDKSGAKTLPDILDEGPVLEFCSFPGLGALRAVSHSLQTSATHQIIGQSYNSLMDNPNLPYEIKQEKWDPGKSYSPGFEDIWCESHDAQTLSYITLNSEFEKFKIVIDSFVRYHDQKVKAEILQLRDNMKQYKIELKSLLAYDLVAIRLNNIPDEDVQSTDVYDHFRKDRLSFDQNLEKQMRVKLKNIYDRVLEIYDNLISRDKSCQMLYQGMLDCLTLTSNHFSGVYTAIIANLRDILSLLELNIKLALYGQLRSLWSNHRAITSASSSALPTNPTFTMLSASSALS
jgi:hypothetical protein